VNILFFMRHPGYVRNFEAVLSELAGRGHHVHISFDGMNTKWMGAADPLGNLAGVTFGPSPRLKSGWQRLATGLRSCDDYLRYQGPEYANAPKLRARAEQRIPLPLHRPLNAAGRFAPPVQRALRALDGSIEVDERLATYMSGLEPDIVLVTPLVGLGSTQADYLKAARAMGRTGGLCVASWDNLTNKGLIREDPDVVAVWNDAQRQEAIGLHATPADRVAVTGAHSYDHWFAWRPTTGREEFYAQAGLDADQPYILYLGSSPFIAPDEHRHVTTWLRGLRERPEQELRDVGVLIRPHPQNARQWENVDFSGLENVTVYPAAGADPVDRRRKDQFFDSIHHSALVVGVNTSAQIESAIVGRSVFTLLTPEFSDTQQGTLHFAHLAADEDGLLHVAETFEEHAHQLAEALRDPDADDARRRAFLERFVRPNGLEEAGAPRLADAIEAAAARGPRSVAAPQPALKVLMWPAAFALSGVKSRARTTRRLTTHARRKVATIRALLSSAHIRRRKRLVRKTVRFAKQLLIPPPRAATRDPQGRILLFLNYPGYLRYFDGVIRELADRGMAVMIVMDRPEKQAEGLRALDGMPDSVQVVGQTPRRDDMLGPIARGLRGTIDYARYLHPRFADADYLRDRRRKALDLAPRMAPLGHISKAPAAVVDLLIKVLRTAERSIPSSSQTASFIASFDPDLVVVSPLVSEASPQTDVVKSAQGLGIPTALCVASWDHLTTKGLIRVLPTQVIVWNDTQAREARELHGVPGEQVTVTGAQPFDRWFGRRPHSERDAFCERVGLPADRPYVLFVGSTAGISGPDAEERFVRRWLTALRQSGDPAPRDVGVLIRPHPYNPGSWAAADLSEFGPVAVWPREGANPVDEDDRNDYFDSMFHSAAVVGINTSAMIESAIIGRPVHTIRADDFARTQDGTLHFHYLLPENGGFLRVATSLVGHVAQLSDSLNHSDEARAELSRFVGTFLRPHGLERSSTPVLADALVALARAERPRPTRVPRALLPLTALLYLGAVRRRYEADGRLAKDTMVTARRMSTAIRAAERKSTRRTAVDDALSRSRRRVLSLTRSIELRASRRYRHVVPKVSPEMKNEHATAEAEAADPATTETTP